MKLRAFFIFQISIFMLLMACNQPADADAPETTVPLVDTASEASPALASPAPLQEPVTSSNISKAAPAPQPKTTAPVRTKPVASTKPAATPAKPKGKPETIYVETYGAQGRVWGHVTLNGDRGTGTIHDWDENTLSVTVTRHGDELFAIDQNSRQYVFKLKK